MVRICVECGLFRGDPEIEDSMCECQPDENGELPETEEFDPTELSDDGYEGDENSDYPANN